LRRLTVKLTPFVCWCLIVCIPIAAWPQSQGTQTTEAKETRLLGEQSAKFKSEVQKRGTGEQARVKITLRDQTEVKGYISQIGAESFQVTDNKSGRTTTIAYQEVRKLRKPGLSTGAKIAIAAGVGVGIAVGASLASLAASGE
jgi:hypothetical protein